MVYVIMIKQQGFLLIGALIIAMLAAILSLQILEQSVVQQRLMSGQVDQLDNKIAVQNALAEARRHLRDDYPMACGDIPCDNRTLLHSATVIWTPVSLSSEELIYSDYTVQKVGQMVMPGFSTVTFYQVTARAGIGNEPNQWVCQLYWAQPDSTKLPAPPEVIIGEQSEHCLV